MEGILLPLVLLLLGAAAFFLEVFIPSGGLISVVALGCVIAAVALAFAKAGTITGVVFLGVSIVLIPACLVAAFVLLPKTPMGKRLMLKIAQTAESGYVAQDLKEEALVGKTGVALSTLRPSGEARINDQRYDVITEGELIDKGAEIEVRNVGGNRIVVREVRSEKNNV